MVHPDKDKFRLLKNAKRKQWKKRKQERTKKERKERLLQEARGMLQKEQVTTALPKAPTKKDSTTQVSSVPAPALPDITLPSTSAGKGLSRG